RGSFLGRESLGFLVDRGGALGGLLRVPLGAHRNLLMLTWVGNLAAVRVRDPRYCDMRRLTRVSRSSRRPSRSRSARPRVPRGVEGERAFSLGCLVVLCYCGGRTRAGCGCFS